MSSTRSTIAPPPFAANALTAIPATPVAGVSYRDPIAGPASSADGWPYAERVNSAEFNQIMFQLSTLASIQDKKGVLGWSSDVDYTEPAIAFGSDGLMYKWASASGPNNGGAQDPTTQPSAFWELFGAPGGHGQCRLSVVSGTQLKLSPYNGNSVVVNGKILRIPAAGVVLSNTGLANATTYYIYLSGTTAAPVLEASTTGHSTHTNGVEIKTGDPSRTLVGMVATVVGANTFADSETQRLCLNWFNRRPLYQVLRNGGYSVTTGNEIGAGAFRLSFLNWADEPINASFDGQAAGNTAASRGDVYLQLDFDASTPTAGFSTVNGATIGANGYAIALTATGYAIPAEGVRHFISAYSYVTTGTLSYSSVGLRNITRG